MKLTPHQLARALFFWESGLDTLDIAIRLGLGRKGEHIVVRSLAERRETIRRAA